MAARGKPWYREFWLWFVLAPLIATVIGSFATLIVAGGPPALVVDDFGQIALTVERNRQRDRRAAELGITADLQFDPGTGGGPEQVAVRLHGDAPAQLRLELIHPTREERDASTTLRRSGDRYAGTVLRPAGRLYLQVGDEAHSWRLTGALAPGQRSARLAPAPAP
jgi:hypothetical protein